MKFDSLIRSNHELKKNGYKIINKLHKMESPHGAKRAYAAQIEDTYFFISGCRALVKIIVIEYPTANNFIEKCYTFLSYLDSIADNRSIIDRTILANFLRAYTRFFNGVIKHKVKFVLNSDVIELWNTKCLMAYIATWGKNH